MCLRCVRTVSGAIPRALAAEPTSAVETEPVRRVVSPRTFEYTGTGVLAVTGAASGATYRFGQGSARVVEVAYEDAFAMMAEPDLRPVRHS